MTHLAQYHAYLVRLWPTQRDGIEDYRVSVQCVATGERRDLSDLQSLLAYLQSQGDAPVDGVLRAPSRLYPGSGDLP